MKYQSILFLTAGLSINSYLCSMEKKERMESAHTISKAVVDTSKSQKTDCLNIKVSKIDDVERTLADELHQAKMQLFTLHIKYNELANSYNTVAANHNELITQLLLIKSRIDERAKQFVEAIDAGEVSTEQRTWLNFCAAELLACLENVDPKDKFDELMKRGTQKQSDK